MQAIVNKYFDRHIFAVTHFTDQYSKNHKLSIAFKLNSVSYKYLKCFKKICKKN